MFVFGRIRILEADIRDRVLSEIYGRTGQSLRAVIRLQN
jgi:hypothetical protein